MALPRLPAELLENIVTHALPEGFEGLALTCRRMHAVCTPFIQDHNTLRLRFHSFDYFHDYVERPDDIRTAFEMIARIAVEPVVARYVRHASFENDSRGSWRCAHALVADLYDGGPVVELFAKSPYLTQAGLNWKEYCAKIEKELVATPPFPTHYSQHAAAFLLTLLPNVETLRLPKQWRPVDATNKLVDVVLRKAKQSHNSCQTPSLAQVTRFEPSVSFVPQDRFDLDWATPFLALPHIRSFRGPGCVAIGGDGHNSVATPDSDDFYGKTLEAIDLSGCCIDEVAIADFLKHTVRLRTLRYSHMEKVTRSIKKWDICKFLTAIEHKVGSHLEELSVSAATDALFTQAQH